ncbi:MAG: hypothetical protein U9N82_03635 [Thermodesulfobacteriota bacterium]|nr:hypothetical protein [Thermodesulfobacteriota bacterium]
MAKKLLALLIGMFFVLMFLPCASMALTGGPDAGGYEYYDSDEEGAVPFTWDDLENSTTATGIEEFHEDLTTILFGPVPIGFTFTFYGVDYTNVYISKHGFLTFNDGPPVMYRDTEPIPTEGGTGDNFIAGMFAQLHPGT